MSKPTSPSPSPPPLTSTLWQNRKCLFICCLVSMANLEFGMDSGVIGTLQAMPGFLVVFGYPNQFVPGGYGLNSTFQQLITSLPILGALVSSLAAGAFSSYLGRRFGLGVACVLTLAGVAIQMNPTDSKGAVYVGRVVLGLGNGFLQTFSNIYCAEAAPAHLRGVMVALSTEWILVGGIVAAAVTNATQVELGKSSYQIPLGILLVLPVLLAVGLPFVPESPRYLITRSEMEAARASLEKLRGDSLSAEGLELEYVEMVRGIEEEKRIAGTVKPLDMFKGTDRRRTLIATGIAVADAGGSGAWFLIPYNVYLMAISGVPSKDAFRYFVINTCSGLVACTLGMFFLRHVCGRRTLLMVGSVLNGAFYFGMAVSATVSLSPERARTLLVAFNSLYLVGYSFATGVVTRPVATELVSTRLRAYSFGLTQAVTQLLIWLVSFCTPYFINPENMHWGGKYGYIWVGSNAVCLVWYFLFVPETKDRSLEDIDELFEKGVATKDFKTHATALREDVLNDIKNGHVGHSERNGNADVEVRETAGV